MELEGTISNGSIVLDAGNRLPEGTKVKVLVPNVTSADSETSLSDFLLSIAGTVDEWPADMASNHDHYLHGASKRGERSPHE